MVLPKQAAIIEVCPRDGFQNIADWIPTEVKAAVVKKLIAAGIREIEVTSFVNPKAVPQMKDAAEVVCEVKKDAPASLRVMALAPNLRGALNAAECGIKDISYVISASEAHNMANVRRSVGESLEELKNLIKELPNACIRLDIATAFGCPYAGSVPEDDVMKLAEQALALGVKELILCDTIGIGNPLQTQSLCRKAIALSNDIPVALHMHNTRGMGLSNIFSGLQEGVTRFETAAGGLGGCPFAPGAAGNTATEDTVNMLESMGIATGVSMDTLLDAVEMIRQSVSANLTSSMIRVKRESACRS